MIRTFSKLPCATMILVTCVTVAGRAQTSPVEYRQHWKSAGDPAWYGKGSITADTPLGKQSPAPLRLKVRLDANPVSPANQEWRLGRDSRWDITRTNDAGTWESVSSPINPSFRDNPGGYLEVTVSFDLANTNQLEKRADFEVYGSVDGLNVSPPNPLTHTMIAIPGKVSWKTGAGGAIDACTVEFGTVTQSRNISATGGTYPQRKSRRLPVFAPPTALSGREIKQRLTPHRGPDLPLLTEAERKVLEDRCLLIIDPAVVNSVHAQNNGPWSFGGQFTAIANPAASGIEPKRLIERWLGEVGEKFAKDVGAIWDQRSQGERKLESLPFRLLAVVNRLDLRNNLVLGDQRIGRGQAGEIRFIYGLHDVKGEPMNFTVILEFAVKRNSAAEVRDWARQWYSLRHFDLKGPQYLAALKEITDQCTTAGIDPESPPLKSGISQIRTNDGSGINSRAWLFEEFRPGVQDDGYLRRVTTKQTPKNDVNNQVVFNRFMADAADEIAAGRHLIPVEFKAEEFLAKSSSIPSFKPDWYWQGDNLPETMLQTRHLVSLNTCNACHTRETNANFFHVSNRMAGAPAALSGFMTGVKVEDPAGQRDPSDPSKVLVRQFNELERRAYDLRNFVVLGDVYEIRRPPVSFVH